MLSNNDKQTNSHGFNLIQTSFPCVPNSDAIYDDCTPGYFNMIFYDMDFKKAQVNK